MNKKDFHMAVLTDFIDHCARLSGGERPRERRRSRVRLGRSMPRAWRRSWGWTSWMTRTRAEKGPSEDGECRLEGKKRGCVFVGRRYSYFSQNGEHVQNGKDLRNL